MSTIYITLVALAFVVGLIIYLNSKTKTATYTCQQCGVTIRVEQLTPDNCPNCGTLLGN